MFLELLADRSRKVMQLASQEAFRLGHGSIGTEHILLGVLKEGSGVTPSMLKRIDRDFRKVRTELEKYLPIGTDTVTVGKLLRTPAATRVLEYAAEEAEKSGYRYPEPEHMVLGLLRSPEEVAGRVLLSFGITAEEVRADIERPDAV